MECGKNAVVPRKVDHLTAEELVRLCEKTDCTKCRQLDGMQLRCRLGYPADWPLRAMDTETGNGAGAGWKVRDMTAAELVRFCRKGNCVTCAMRDGVQCLIGCPGGWPGIAMQMDLERDRRKEGDGHGG